jgi:AcrR family transcriptional regulator
MVTQSAEVTGAALGTVQPPSRRDRLRAATIDEIIQTARQLLVKDGPEAVSLRAIAREMGMTAPGLYRYFGSYEELHRYLCANIFTELGADIGRAIEAATAPSEDPHAKLTVKMVAACREFRRWALTHKDEFALVFGVPLPGLDDGRYDIADECALAFAGTFFTLFLELWQRNPFPVLAREEIDPGLREQLELYRDRIGIGLSAAELPVGAMLTFLRCWTKLYGAVTLEAFDHLRFALDDPAPMFDYTLAEMAAQLGLEYPPRLAGPVATARSGASGARKA